MKARLKGIGLDQKPALKVHYANTSFNPSSFQSSFIMSQLVWLITGCSSGFGEQFTHSILARGDKVIATARNVSKIKQLEDMGAAALQLDIADNQATINDTIARATRIYGRIDILINNASYISIGTWEDLEYDDFLAQFDTNVFGTIKVTRALLTHLRERRAGNIVFIGSLSGWIGHPFVSAYAGSKFALEGIIEGLSKETAHLGIKSLLIEPGRFRTKLLSGTNLKSVASKIPDYADFSQTMLLGLASEDSKQPGDPVKLVEIILDLVEAGRCCQGQRNPVSSTSRRRRLR